ncbi:MAG TPA: hypothetical protein VMS64_24175 [Candidatus Methylomirabilis sp.]|nr:hypothetical protein [Candidatus Methylomirabilis sp.]
MGLGRTTRFAAAPRGSRRVSVMRAGPAGVKALAPPADLFEAFRREKTKRTKEGLDADRAHREAYAVTRYRQRFLDHVRSSATSMQALRALVAEARERDVYLMCMCPYRTPGEACHTYLLLELAREIDPTIEILAEPRPKRR